MRNSIRAVIVGSWIAALFWMERRRTLRPTKESKIRRDVRNLEVAAGAALIMQCLEAPVAFPLAGWVERRRWGIVQHLPCPALLRDVLAVVLLDYTLYLWHVLAHRSAFLWRFHLVHHLDREMDATTALRFHFGEMAVSVLFRIVQVLVIGPSQRTLAAWQLFLMLCILFHHSNLELPIEVERKLARLLVTPRLHGIHHSIAPEQVNSNWSSGLTVWDWLHGTLRTEVPQASLVLGVAGFLDNESQEFDNLMKLPFTQESGVIPMPHMSFRQPLSGLAR